MVYNELNEKYGIEFLMTRQLTQDCIENVFSIVRSKGGNNITPDATKFHSAIRMCMCNSLLTPSESGNCETDAVQFLTKFSDLKNIKIKMKLINDIDKDQLCNTEDLSDLDLSSINIQNILMEDHQACAIG